MYLTAYQSLFMEFSEHQVINFLQGFSNCHLSLQPGVGGQQQQQQQQQQPHPKTPQHTESSTGSSALATRSAGSRVDGGADPGAAPGYTRGGGAGLGPGLGPGGGGGGGLSRHPRRHTSYHNPIPSAWHSNSSGAASSTQAASSSQPATPERQLSYGERQFGGWRETWRDGAEKHRGSRRSDIGPDSSDTSYHFAADSNYYIGMGFGLDALRKKRRTTSPGRSRSNSSNVADSAFDDVDGSTKATASNSDVTLTSSQRNSSATSVSSSGSRHRRSNSSEGLLDSSEAATKVKTEKSGNSASGMQSNSGMPVSVSAAPPSSSTSSHLTYRGVRSMKHGKSDKHQDGLRKASSLQDLSTTRGDGAEGGPGPGGTPAAPHRSRSRESLPDLPVSAPATPSASTHRSRSVSDVSHFATYNKPPHHTHSPPNHGAPDSNTDTSRPKTFFETLRDSLLNPEPPKPKNYRYLKLAGIPQTKSIENYGSDHSIHRKPRPRPYPSDKPSSTPVTTKTTTTTAAVVHRTTNPGDSQRNVHRDSSAGDLWCGAAADDDINRNRFSSSSSRNVASSPSSTTFSFSSVGGVTNNTENAQSSFSSRGVSVGDAAHTQWNEPAHQDRHFSAKTAVSPSTNQTPPGGRNGRYPTSHDVSPVNATGTLHDANNGGAVSARSHGSMRVHYVGTSMGSSRKARGSADTAGGRQPDPVEPPSPAPSFAWEPSKRAIEVAKERESNSVTRRGNFEEGGFVNRGWDLSDAQSDLGGASSENPPQERRITRSVSSGPAAGAAASPSDSGASGSAARGRAGGWRSVSADRGSPPGGPRGQGSAGSGGSSAGSTDSYEDYFCRSPSPNSFFLNGKNKNETDEHKVSGK